jgi:hypothetical protein
MRFEGASGQPSAVSRQEKPGFAVNQRQRRTNETTGQVAQRQPGAQGELKADG